VLPDSENQSAETVSHIIQLQRR